MVPTLAHRCMLLIFLFLPVRTLNLLFMPIVSLWSIQSSPSMAGPCHLDCTVSVCAPRMQPYQMCCWLTYPFASALFHFSACICGSIFLDLIHVHLWCMEPWTSPSLWLLFKWMCCFSCLVMNQQKQNQCYCFPSTMTVC